MDSYELVTRTLRFEKPERIPRQLWVLPSAFLRHGEDLVALLRRYPVDINPRSLEIPELTPEWRKGAYVDEWGSVWLNLEDGIAGEVKQPVLQDWSALDRLRPPELSADLAAPAEDVLRRRPDAFAMLVGGQIFERLQYLRGTENLYMDLMDQSAELLRLRDILMDYLRRRVARCIKAPCHGVQFADDWGSQRSLLISPELWRSFFKPCYAELFQMVKQAGKFVFMHSDGCIMDIIEDLIELGVDALNCQVWVMGPEELGRRFRGRITFWGEINRQTTLPQGTPADVRKSVEVMKANLAAPQGGLIAQSEVDRMTPLENIEAVLQPW
ncbi:MAG: uroporphyrinogen decarboxylase family protein [Kiritimatiellia bacterium]